MTDEKMAIEYADKNWEYYEKGQDDYEALKQAFLAGLKVAKPQWHDLRKNPNDLPENKRDVWCDYGEGSGKGHYNKDNGGWWIEGHMFWSIIDAWCELPTFDKE